MELLCPVCHEVLTREDRRAVCIHGHSFDYARSGYLNLQINQRTDQGDNKLMVNARTAFLHTGAYAFLKEELTRLSQKYSPEVLADLGCGEGYYTSSLCAQRKYGFDLSKDALIYASRHDHSTQYILASIFHLPLADHCADLALTCFAPPALSEVERILKDNGHYIFISPGPDHLFEMKSLLYEKPYKNVVSPLGTTMSLKEEYTIEQIFTADREQLQNLFRMTPYAYRTSLRATQKLEDIQTVKITAQFILRIYQKEKQ